MRFLSRRRFAQSVAALSVAAALVGAGVLIGAGAASATPTAIFANGIANLMIVTDDQPTTVTSTTWQSISSNNFTYGPARFIRVRFSGESVCSGTGGWCSLRIMVGGVEARPAVGTDFAFYSPGDQWESHSVERVVPAPGSGFVSVSVEVTVVAGATSERLDDWMLSVEVLA